MTEKQKAFVALWGQVPYRSAAQVARIVGVTSQTVSGWRHDDPAFVAACDQARQQSTDAYLSEEKQALANAVPKARRQLIANLKSDSAAISQAAAEFIWKSFFAPVPTRSVHEVSGSIDHDHHTNLDRASDEQLDILERILTELAEGASSEGEAPSP